MRILNPSQTIAAKDVVSSIFALSIRICDVDHVLSERITSDIEHYLSQSAAEAVMARNEADATILDLACTIRYTRNVNQGNLTRNLRKRHIYPCFPEKNTGGRAIHVDVRPLERWDDSTVETMSSMWSKSPWRLVFAGFGAPKGRAAGQRRAFRDHSIMFGLGCLLCFVNSSSSSVPDDGCRTAGATSFVEPARTSRTSGGKNRAAACDAVVAAGADAAAAATAAAAAIYGFDAGKGIPAGRAAGLDCLLYFVDSSASPVSEKW